MRLIDKDYFIGAMEESKKIHGEYSVSINNFINSLKSAPTVDAVEVVRCRECKRYTNYDNYQRKKLGFSWCDKFANITKPSDFCSYGERKENT